MSSTWENTHLLWLQVGWHDRSFVATQERSAWPVLQVVRDGGLKGHGEVLPDHHWAECKSVSTQGRRNGNPMGMARAGGRFTCFLVFGWEAPEEVYFWWQQEQQEVRIWKRWWTTTLSIKVLPSKQYYHLQRLGQCQKTSLMFWESLMDWEVEGGSKTLADDIRGIGASLGEDCDWCPRTGPFGTWEDDDYSFSPLSPSWYWTHKCLKPSRESQDWGTPHQLGHTAYYEWRGCEYRALTNKYPQPQKWARRVKKKRGVGCRQRIKSSTRSKTPGWVAHRPLT